MINNFPMFHRNIFIICVLITIFIYIGKKTVKIVSFSIQIIRRMHILKSAGAISKIVQIGSNLFVTYFLMYSL